MSTSTTKESQTQQHATDKSQDLVSRPMNVELVSQGDEPQLNKSATAKVFGITELLEMILIETDQHSLHTALPRVSKDFALPILGSTKLQRSLHKVPDWKHTKMCPAPLPPSVTAFTAHKNGLYDHNTSPVIEPGARHRINVRFNEGFITWACDPYSTTNAAFRGMLICQPPVVAVEVSCFSAVNYLPKLVEILFKVNVKDYRGKFAGVMNHTIYAHKVVLAAGSRRFREHFETHAQEAGTTTYTIVASDLCSASNEVFMAVLRYLYSVPKSPDDQDQDTLGAMDWRSLCDVADKFGIPSLRKTAVPKMEVYLEGLLKAGLPGTMDFVWEVRNIYELGSHKDSTAIEVAAKLTWRNFAELRKREDFQELTDKHPEFLRAVLDHAARDGVSSQ